MTAMQVLCCKSEVVRDLMSAEEADDDFKDQLSSLASFFQSQSQSQSESRFHFQAVVSLDTIVPVQLLFQICCKFAFMNHPHCQRSSRHGIAERAIAHKRGGAE